MEVPHSIQASEFRESRVHELDLKTTLTKLPKTTISLGRHATMGPAQGMWHPRPSGYLAFAILYGRPPP
jgi:hypothetical protein